MSTLARTKVMFWQFILIFLGYGIANFGLGRVTAPEVQCQAPRVGAGEVTDLIDRLKPFMKEPTSRWYGTRITFTGAGVAVELNMANGDKYSGEARTLGAAVSRITAPSADIKTALEGWSAP